MNRVMESNKSASNKKQGATADLYDQMVTLSGNRVRQEVLKCYRNATSITSVLNMRDALVRVKKHANDEMKNRQAKSDSVIENYINRSKFNGSKKVLWHNNRSREEWLAIDSRLVFQNVRDDNITVNSKSFLATALQFRNMDHWFFFSVQDWKRGFHIHCYPIFMMMREKLLDRSIAILNKKVAILRGDYFEGTNHDEDNEPEELADLAAHYLGEEWRERYDRLTFKQEKHKKHVREMEAHGKTGKKRSMNDHIQEIDESETTKVSLIQQSKRKLGFREDKMDRETPYFSGGAFKGAKAEFEALEPVFDEVPMFQQEEYWENDEELEEILNNSMAQDANQKWYFFFELHQQVFEPVLRQLRSCFDTNIYHMKPMTLRLTRRQKGSVAEHSPWFKTRFEKLVSSKQIRDCSDAYWNMCLDEHLRIMALRIHDAEYEGQVPTKQKIKSTYDPDIDESLQDQITVLEFLRAGDFISARNYVAKLSPSRRDELYATEPEIEDIFEPVPKVFGQVSQIMNMVKHGVVGDSPIAAQVLACLDFFLKSTLSTISIYKAAQTKKYAQKIERDFPSACEQATNIVSAQNDIIVCQGIRLADDILAFATRMIGTSPSAQRWIRKIVRSIFAKKLDQEAYVPPKSVPSAEPEASRPEEDGEESDDQKEPKEKDINKIISNIRDDGSREWYDHMIWWGENMQMMMDSALVSGLCAITAKVLGMAIIPKSAQDFSRDYFIVPEATPMSHLPLLFSGLLHHIGIVGKAFAMQKKENGGNENYFEALFYTVSPNSTLMKVQELTGKMKRVYLTSRTPDKDVPLCEFEREFKALKVAIEARKVTDSGLSTFLTSRKTKELNQRMFAKVEEQFQKLETAYNLLLIEPITPPFQMVVYGLPNAAKTAFLYRCSAWAQHADGIAASNTNIYVLPPDSDFVSGYNNQHTFIMNDVAIAHLNIVKSQGDKTLSMWTQCGGNIPHIMPHETAEKKESNRFHSRLFAADTNVAHCNSVAATNNPPAFFRRGIHVNVKVLPEYADQGIVSKEKIAEASKKLGRPIVDIWSVNVRTYEAVDATTKIRETFNEDMNMSQFKVWFQAKYQEHFNHNGMVLDNIKNANACDQPNDYESSKFYEEPTLVWCTEKDKEGTYRKVCKYVQSVDGEHKWMHYGDILEQLETTNNNLRQVIEVANIQPDGSVINGKAKFGNREVKIKEQGDKIRSLESQVAALKMRLKDDPNGEYESKFSLGLDVLDFASGKPGAALKTIANVTKMNIRNGTFTAKQFAEAAGIKIKVNVDEEEDGWSIYKKMGLMIGGMMAGGAMMALWQKFTAKPKAEWESYNFLKTSTLEPNSYIEAFQVPQIRRSTNTRSWDAVHSDRVVGAKHQLDHVINAVHQNMVEFGYYDKKTRKRHGTYYGLGLYGKVMLTNVHTIAYLKKYQRGHLGRNTNVIPVELNTCMGGHNFDNLLLREARIVKGDLVVVPLGARFFSDIRPYISEKEQYGRQSVRVTYGKATEVTCDQATELNLKFKEDDNQFCPKYLPQSCFVASREGTSDEHKGECGFLYVANIAGSATITGMHVAGGKGFHVAQKLCRDDLCEIANPECVRLSLGLMRADPVEPPKDHSLRYIEPSVYGFSALYAVGQPTNSKSKLHFHSDVVDEFSRIIEEDFYVDGRPVYAPAKLFRYNRHGVMKNPYVGYMEDFQLHKRGYVPQDMVDEAVEAYIDFIVPKLKARGFGYTKPYSFEAAINGTVSDSFMNRMNGSTSGGFGFPGAKRAHLILKDISPEEAFEKGILPGDADYPPGFYQDASDDVKKEVCYNFECYKRGLMSHSIKKAVLKDEPRKTKPLSIEDVVSALEKAGMENIVVEGRKVSYTKNGVEKFTVVPENAFAIKDARVFNPDSFEQGITDRMIDNEFYSAYSQHGDIFLSALGVNCHSKQWGDMYNYFTTEDGWDASEHMGELDFPKFDISNAESIDYCAKLFKYRLAKRFDIPDWYLDLILCTSLESCVSIICVEGVLIFVRNINPSGKNATTQDNCTKNVLCQIIMWQIRATKWGEIYKYDANYTTEYETKDFFRFTKSRVTGDDVVCGYHPSVSHFWNMVGMASAYACTGVHLTDGDKNQIGPDSRQLMNISEVRFLQRMFKKHRHIGIAAPLAKTSLFKMVLFTLKPRLAEVTVESVFEECVFKCAEELVAIIDDEEVWEQKFHDLLVMLSNKTNRPLSYYKSLNWSYKRFLEERFNVSLNNQLVPAEYEAMDTGKAEANHGDQSTPAETEHKTDGPSHFITTTLATNVSAVPRHAQIASSKLNGNIEFFKRPIRIHNDSWAIGASYYQSYDVFNDWADNPAVRAKLRNYSFCRVDLTVRITVNATPFHQGMLMFSWQPLSDSNDVLNSLQLYVPTGGNVEDLITAYCSQSQHIAYAMVNDNGAVELDIPFIWYNYYFRFCAQSQSTGSLTGQPLFTTPAVDNSVTMGRLFVRSLTTLGSANNNVVDPAQIMVQVYAKNIELLPPTAKPMAVPENDEYTGPVSSVASAVARTLGSFQDIPIVGAYATATGKIADGIAHLSSLFGFSRPQHVEPHKFIKRWHYANEANANGHDTCYTLGVDIKREMTLDQTLTGDSSDPMNIGEICKREMWMGTLDWTGDDAEGDTIMAVPCYAENYVAANDNVASNRAIVQSPGMFATRFFKRYRCSVVYRFVVISSKFHRGRLAILFDPETQNMGSTITTNIDLNTQYNCVWDIQATNTMTVKIPFTGAMPFIEHISQVDGLTTGGFASGFPQVADYANTDMTRWAFGAMQLRVIQPLIDPADSGAKIAVFVHLEDVEVLQPDAINERYSYNPAQAYPESAEWESQEILSDCTEIIGDPMNDNNLFMYHGGEALASLRPLLKRYTGSTIAVINEPSVTAQPRIVSRNQDLYPWGYQPFGSSLPVSNYFDRCAFSMMRWAFVGMRGGMRYKYLFASPAIPGPVKVSNSNATGTGGSFAEFQMTSVVATPDTITGAGLGARDGMLTSTKGSITVATDDGVEFEVPYYASRVFDVAFASNVYTDPYRYFGSGVTNTFYIARLYYGTGTDWQTTFYNSTAAAEDFTFLHFQGAPVLYVQVTG